MRVCIFDFDGVIADTFAYSQAVISRIGITVTQDQFKDHHNGNVFEKPIVPFTPENRVVFHRVYGEGIASVPLFISRTEFETLAQEYTLCIVSSNDEHAISQYLLSHNITQFSDVLGCEFHKSKVHKIQYLMQKYGVNEKDCVFVTDTVGDVLESHQLSVPVIAVSYGYHDLERLARANPTHLVNAVPQLLTLLHNLKTTSQ